MGRQQKRADFSTTAAFKVTLSRRTSSTMGSPSYSKFPPQRSHSVSNDNLDL